MNRFGHYRGFQRFRCRQCGKSFSEIPERPLNDLRIAPEKAHQVIAMLAEGCGIRTAERLSGINRSTVLNILETAGEKCARLMETRVSNLKVEQVQIDEIYSFVNCLQATTTADDLARGDQYVFLGIERTSKLILHWHVGKRDRPNAMAFLRGLKAKLQRSRFQLTSDGFMAYCGQTGGVWQVFRESIDYGIETKHFASTGRLLTGKGKRREHPVVCQWVKRVPHIGNPDPGNITVNHAERTNLSVRLFNRRFTRKTMGFSKTLRNHRHSVALLVAHFNFCRVHSAHQKTPAMAQGLTDHVWTVAELLEAGTS